MGLVGTETREDSYTCYCVQKAENKKYTTEGGNFFYCKMHLEGGGVLLLLPDNSKPAFKAARGRSGQVLMEKAISFTFFPCVRNTAFKKEKWPNAAT